MNPFDLQRKNEIKKSIDSRREVILSKLIEFRVNHWKINEENQINSIARNLRNSVKG